MKIGLPVAKFAEKLYFFRTQKKKITVLILGSYFLNFFHTTLCPLPLPVFFIHLQLPNMIPWSLAATIEVPFLNFIIINFYSVQVFKLEKKTILYFY